MSINNPYQTYKNNSAETASPGELTLMLYNGCLKFLKQARKAMQENSIEDKNKNMLKAQDIIRELMFTLDMKQEISENLMQMYDYILSQLIEANMQNDFKALDEAEKYVLDFRNTWKEVIQINRRIKHGD